MKIFNGVNKNRWFFWAIAILMVSGLALILVIQNSIQEFEKQAIELTSVTVHTWKTFHSKSLEISVQYPYAWQIEIDPSYPNTISFENPKNFNENVSISLIEPEFEKVIRNSLVDKNLVENDVVVNGLKGKWLANDATNDKATQNVIFVHSAGKEYYIAGSAKQFGRIIKSIKFSQ